MEQSWSVKELTEFVAGSVQNARQGSTFYRSQFDRIFPPDSCAEMLRTMPDESDHRPMSGKSGSGPDYLVVVAVPAALRPTCRKNPNID